MNSSLDVPPRSSFYILISLLLVVAIGLGLVWVVDPYQAASPDLARLYSDEVKSASFPMNIGVTLVWLIASIGIAVIAARWCSKRASRRIDQTGAFTLATGLILVGTFLPGFYVGLSFITDAENGGYDVRTNGFTLLVVFQLVGCALIVLGLAFGLSSMVRNALRSRSN